jgi:hypothetical protein
MAKRGKRSKAVFSAAEIINIARSNPYIERLMEDQKLRKQVSTALNSSKAVYVRLTNGKVAPQILLEDKKLHSDVGRALGAARDASIILINTPRRRRRRLTLGRVVMIGAVATGVALAVSEGLRSKALDLLFGAEEEFQYTPPPDSSSPAETTSVGAS